MKYATLLFSSFALISCANSKGVTTSDIKQVKACVLYATNDNKSYPIPKLECAITRLDIHCDEKVINSDNLSKIWRSYPVNQCDSVNIKATLSKRYLVEGLD